MTWLAGHYVINVGAFLIGFLLGYLVRRYIESKGYRMLDLFRHLVRRVEKWMGDSRVIAIVASASFVAAGWTVVAQGRDSASLVRCVQVYADQQSKAQKPRTDANSEKDKALNKVITAAGRVFLSNSERPDLTELRAALIDYQAKTTELEAERRKHPYPEPPTTLCEDR